MILNALQQGSDDREAVVLLHSLALDAGVWQSVVPLLESQFRVVALDLRGHGNSPRSVEFTIEDLADDVAEKTAQQWEDYDRTSDFQQQHLDAMMAVLDAENPGYAS